ncbi:MAG TPA: hypothetical protein VHZ02_14605 [Acidimicrobiales bacterium]|nr:hypothetical protein [Acidimicrobiales bacterium]
MAFHMATRSFRRSDGQSCWHLHDADPALLREADPVLWHEADPVGRQPATVR